MWNDTIAAIATAPGTGAIAVIRVSGKDAVDIVNKLFPSKDLAKQRTRTLHYGVLNYNGEDIDEVLLSLFLSPKSYTGENTVEISCHGSQYIQEKILQVIIENGARLAQPGEFTQRAFLNGKLDLSQAEAVADLIAADTQAAQKTALHNLRGRFSNDLKVMREQLINFAALIELELDFSEEDIEFANRTELRDLVARLRKKVLDLLRSFKYGNAIRNGISVAIIGKPNAGKSTLLNALLNEERAIVSDIAGTTRDTIEEKLNINGIHFRLIDTAGIREHSSDVIENIGMERSRQNAAKADIILYLNDLTEKNSFEPDSGLFDLGWLEPFRPKVIKVHTKLNKWTNQLNELGISVDPSVHQNVIDAKEGVGVETLKASIYKKAMADVNNTTEGSIITNARHFEALQKMDESLQAVEAGLNTGLSGDLLTIDIRRALHYLGEITGQVEVDRDILGTIFGKFCIGK